MLFPLTSLFRSQTALAQCLHFRTGYGFCPLPPRALKAGFSEVEGFCFEGGLGMLSGQGMGRRMIHVRNMSYKCAHLLHLVPLQGPNHSFPPSLRFRGRGWMWVIWGGRKRLWYERSGPHAVAATTIAPLVLPFSGTNAPFDYAQWRPA